MDQNCPECGAKWVDDQTCEQAFHQMLFWEAEDSAVWVVHHLMVICYYLQHPSLYSPEGLKHSAGLLHQFVEEKISPQEVRRQQKEQVDSGKRDWKIAGAKHGNPGSYSVPVAWKVTAPEVISGGIEHYIERVYAWAEATNAGLRGIGM
jgi:hypothetical protein